ncbi:hypothetical protein D3C72_1539750 [compost metagenome]
MRFIILSVLASLIHTAAFANTSGSGFEGTYKVERISQVVGPWKDFWIRPKVTQLEEILVEDTGNNLYIGLKDAQGVTWSANYGVCTGSPNEYCNAHKSEDGKTLEFEFVGDMTRFVITLGEHQGQLVWYGDKATASLVFDHSRK